MPKVLQQALAPPQPAQFVDPYEQQRAALQARMDALGAGGGGFSEEEMQRRREQNQQQYEMGLLAQLSGSEQLQRVGPQVLKQALADRTPHVTERGTYDPLQGKWAYNPEYQRAQLQTQLDRYDTASAGSRERYDREQRDTATRRETREDQQQFRREMVGAAASNRPEPLVAVIGPDGQPTLVQRSQAAGMRPAPAGGGGNPSEGERNAAGFHARMSHATGLLDAFEAGGGQTLGTQLAGAVPGVGGYLQTQAMTVQQQLYMQAAQDWVRAKLRKESGAAIGKDEMAQEIRTYFPMPGESPELKAQKRAAREVATRAMQAAAGRATIPGGTQGAAGAPGAPGGAADDPLGLRR